MCKSIPVLFLAASFVFGDQSGDEFKAILLQIFGPNSTATKAPATSTNSPTSSVTVDQNGDNVNAVLLQIFGPNSNTTSKPENTSVTVNKDGVSLEAVIEQIFGPKPKSSTTTITPTDCLNQEDQAQCMTADGKKGHCLQSYNCDSVHQENLDHLFYCFIDDAVTGPKEDPACDIYYNVICCPF